MESRISSYTSLVLLVMAASSLMSMLFLMQIDGIVHRDLYKYGLRFDVQWAQPYWTLTLGIFGIGWFNIIVALIIHACMLYQLAKRRKEIRIASFQREVVKSEMPLPSKLGRKKKKKVKI